MALPPRGHDAHPGKTADDAGPVLEVVASHEDEFIGAVGLFDDAGACDLALLPIQFARPGRDALQVIRCDHDPLNRPPSIRNTRMLHCNSDLAPCASEQDASHAGEICRRIVRHKTFQSTALPY